MYIKSKCCFLKEDINPNVLCKYGFKTTNGGKSYHKDISLNELIMWYKDTRRFVFKYPKTTNFKKLRKYLNRLMLDNLIEVKPMYEWLAIIGRYQDYSPEKMERINKELDKRNNKLWNKDQ